MDIDYQTLAFEYRACADRRASEAALYPAIVVGAGPVGLASAIDLAQQGARVVLLDDDCTLSSGSRAICFSKRTLEILDRLGCGERLVQKGVNWNVGKVFLQDELIYAFNLLPETGHERPAFINLQQYYVEGFLAERASELPNLEIRWKNKVVGIGQREEHVQVRIETPDGEYALRAKYLVAADGSKSPLRTLMGLDTHGRTFKDRFLIADAKMKADFPTERWFWFDPPFHRNQSVLLHRQPDNVWRIDFQLGWDADPVAEKELERVIARVRALLGPDVEFELARVSVYTFRCRRMDAFRHGRVLFAGAAPERLLDTYASEREFAADENIRHSTRATDFITPKSDVSPVFRDGTLRLAKDCAFAPRLVNSGRPPERQSIRSIKGETPCQPTLVTTSSRATSPASRTNSPPKRCPEPCRAAATRRSARPTASMPSSCPAPRSPRRARTTAARGCIGFVRRRCIGRSRRCPRIGSLRTSTTCRRRRPTSCAGTRCQCPPSRPISSTAG
jgi:3-(3-hydroxy-phenyl)propionate hydroxylase